MLLWSQPRVESPRHAVANLMCVECGKLVACTDECVYTWFYTMGSHKIKGFFSGIFGIYHQDQRKEEFQLHLLVKLIYP